MMPPPVYQSIINYEELKLAKVHTGDSDTDKLALHCHLHTCSMEVNTKAKETNWNIYVNT